MTFAKSTLLAGFCALSAGLDVAPAYANSAALDYFQNRAERTAVPKLLSQDERTYYQALFAAINAEDWAKTQTLLAQKADGPLHLVARAEYYVDPKSPKIDVASLDQWLAQGAGLPEAEQVAALAAKRGSAVTIALPTAQPFASLPSSPKRLRPRDTNDGTMPSSIAAGIVAKIKADDPIGARILLDGIEATLSPAARAEWRTKVAWAFYIENDDSTALALANSTAEGAGPWVAEGMWTAGLAAWRIGDFPSAAEAFGRSASQRQSPTAAQSNSLGAFCHRQFAYRCEEWPTLDGRPGGTRKRQGHALFAQADSRAPHHVQRSD